MEGVDGLCWPLKSGSSWSWGKGQQSLTFPGTLPSGYSCYNCSFCSSSVGLDCCHWGPSSLYSGCSNPMVQAPWEMPLVPYSLPSPLPKDTLLSTGLHLPWERLPQVPFHYPIHHLVLQKYYWVRDHAWLATMAGQHGAVPTIAKTAGGAFWHPL